MGIMGGPGVTGGLGGGGTYPEIQHSDNLYCAFTHRVGIVSYFNDIVFCAVIIKLETCVKLVSEKITKKSDK